MMSNHLETKSLRNRSARCDDYIQSSRKAKHNLRPQLNRLSELMLKADADPEISNVITGSGKFAPD